MYVMDVKWSGFGHHMSLAVGKCCVAKGWRTVAEVSNALRMSYSPQDWEEANLEEMFTPYGAIKSAAISRDATNLLQKVLAMLQALVEKHISWL